MKPEDVTQEQIIEAALDYARQFGIEASARDCTVRRNPNRNLVVHESTGPLTIRDAVWKWDVIIVGTAPGRPNGVRVCVPVEFLSGDVCAMDLIEL